MIYISLDRESSVSLSKQLYSFLKEATLTGSLKQGEKLPSTRELSKNLNIARNVVIDSYEQLIAEGYAYTKNGAGTYICEGVFLEKLPTKKGDKTGIKTIEQSPSDTISFRTGIPDLASVPLKKWGQLYKEVTLSLQPDQINYQSSYGNYELRYQLSLYLRRVRGVNAAPQNILITNGAAQAFSLLCQFVSENEYALVENPLSYGILHTLDSNKVKMQPIRLDEYGMVTSELPGIPPRFIFTTPSHQFPTGVVLPINRRIEMIQYARKHNVYIVEDDYDSEFRFNGSPIHSMQHLDPARVIYVGTFSKTFMPALRIGYVVLPDAICAQMKEAKYVADIHSPILEQLTLAEFIKSGLFDRHIRKMRQLYLKRRNYLIECLKETFKNKVTISGADAGLHLIATFHNVCFDNTLMQKIEKHGVTISDVNRHYVTSKFDTNCNHSLIFGYGNTDFAAIELGVKRLHKAVSQVKLSD